MSSIKRHNHRIHPCAPERKAELLKHLLTCNETQSILVVSKEDSKEVQAVVDDKNIIVSDDASLADFPELKRDLLISYDLPATPEAYNARLSHANTHALILLDPKDQIHLYPIETALGRTLMQEVVSGFEMDDFSTKPAKKRPAKNNDYNVTDSRNAKPKGSKKPFSDKKNYNAKSSSKAKPKPRGKRVSIKAIKPKES